jgi:hypothetical protein
VNVELDIIKNVKLKNKSVFNFQICVLCIIKQPYGCAATAKAWCLLSRHLTNKLLSHLMLLLHWNVVADTKVKQRLTSFN